MQHPRERGRVCAGAGLLDRHGTVGRDPLDEPALLRRELGEQSVEQRGDVRVPEFAVRGAPLSALADEEPGGAGGIREGEEQPEHPARAAEEQRERALLDRFAEQILEDRGGARQIEIRHRHDRLGPDRGQFGVAQPARALGEHDAETEALAQCGDRAEGERVDEVGIVEREHVVRGERCGERVDGRGEIPRPRSDAEPAAQVLEHVAGLLGGEPIARGRDNAHTGALELGDDGAERGAAPAQALAGDAHVAARAHRRERVCHHLIQNGHRAAPSRSLGGSARPPVRQLRGSWPGARGSRAGVGWGGVGRGGVALGARVLGVTGEPRESG